MVNLKLFCLLTKQNFFYYDISIQMKTILGITLGLTVLLGNVTKVHAAAFNLCSSDAKFKALCNLNYNNLGSLIGTLITIVLILAIILAVFFLIYGGIRWITSGGDKTAVEAARGHIVAAIVGLVIALLAFFIINIIGGLFGLDLTNLTLPKLV